MDPDVVEIPPPIPSPPPRMFKHKEIDLGSVIEIEDDGDSAGMMFYDKKNKGKAIKIVSDGYSDRLVEEAGLNLFGPSGEQGIASTNGIESSKGFFAGTATIINLDDHSSDESCDYVDDYNDLFLDEDMDIDEYAMLQAHFDNSDIPPGVEAPVPFLLDPHQSNKNPNTPMQSDLADLSAINTSSSSKLAEPAYLSSMFNPGNGSSMLTQMDYTSQPTQTCLMQSDSVGPHGMNSSSSSRFPKPAHLGLMPSFSGSSSLPNGVDNAGQPTVVDMPSPWSLPQPGQSKRKVSNLQHKGSASSSALGVLSKSRWRRPFQGRKKPSNSSSPASIDSVNQSNGLKLPSVVDPSFWEPYVPDHQQIGTSSYHGLNYSTHMGTQVESLGLAKHPPGVGQSLSWSQPPVKANDFKASIFGIAHPNFDPWGSAAYNPAADMADVPWFGNFNPMLKREFAPPSLEYDVPVTSCADKAEVLKKFQIFKQFDTVEDHSDHHYKDKGSSLKQSSKNWAKRIQEEWKILEKDLPENIFVRVYESRMDLLRAVIVGAEGTPYHDGLFFFDVFFPNSYPNVPPHVYYHSGGLRLNPNLYITGKVCLSLLNTWSGSKNEKWLPGTSTMLQVLVSIQALILNAKPYFNEPGYAHLASTNDGEKKSLQYNESTFILSLKTMTYSIRRPPKHFGDFMLGHFMTHGHAILVACKAYMEGAQVGCLVKGGVQDVDEGDMSSSKQFKDSLAGFVQVLVKDFSRIGVEDCDKYLPPVVNANSGDTAGSSTSRTALRLLSISG